LQQSDEQFAYDVIARVLDRSVDCNRFLDTLFFALMASQAAIYAIILDKVQEYPAVGREMLLGAFVVAILGSTLTVFGRGGPDPRGFVADFPDDPAGTRRQYIEKYILKARRNEQLRTGKTVILALSIAMTVVPLAIATVSRAGGV
jgi:hypothetical protein